VISALVIEPAGTPVPDGTVVQFFTNLGRIQEQGKTNDGVVRVNLISDTRSGTATVTAVSGGGSVPTPAPSPSPSPTGGGGIVGGAAAISAIAATASCTVRIGSSRPDRIILTANPPRITGSGPTRQSRIVANVFDVDGNPITNVPVIFQVKQEPNTLPNEDTSATETLASGSAPVFTDGSGQATDFLQTRYPGDAEPKVVTVTATVPLIEAPAEVLVQIN
jgi:hypothetical protein